MRRLAIGVALACFVGTGQASAECTVAGDPGAAARPMNAANQADADLVVSMSLMPKLMQVDYKSLDAKHPACDLGALVAGGESYEVYGDDSHGRQRQARSARKDAPIATMLPVTNILKAMEASKRGAVAQTEGYMLAVVDRRSFTAWRFYTGMPDLAMIRHDMADALIGAGTPIFRTGTDGKTQLFVPKG